MCIWLWRKPANNIHCMSYLDQTSISAIMDARIIWWMAMGSCQDAHLFHKMSIWIWSNGHLTWFRWSCPGWDPNCTGELGTILVGTDGHLENLGQCRGWLWILEIQPTISTLSLRTLHREYSDLLLRINSPPLSILTDLASWWVKGSWKLDMMVNLNLGRSGSSGCSSFQCFTWWLSSSWFPCPSDGLWNIPQLI